jgi:hypothetical protein
MIAFFRKSGLFRYPIQLVFVTGVALTMATWPASSSY